jgi:MFS family permease
MAKGTQERIDWKFMLPLVLGTMMNPLNSTMLSTALTTICHGFNKEIGSGSLLITPLYIAATIGQPLMGRLADLYDPKLINRLGFLLVLFGALVGVFAPSFSWLIVSRVLLGLGTSAAYPSGMAILTHKYRSMNLTVPANVLGIMVLSSQVSMVLGPILGGFLTQWFGWQGIFFINIPWVLASLYLSKNVPHVERAKIVGRSVFKTIDVVGVFSFAVALVFLLVMLAGYLPFAWSFILFLASFLFFIGWERMQKTPFVDVNLLWHKPSLFLVYVRTLATFYIMYLMMYSMPQWVEAIKHLTPGETGMIMFPLSVMSALSVFMLSKSNNLFKTNVISLVFMVLACMSLFFLNSSSVIFVIVLIVMLVGVAIGTNSLTNQSSLSAEAPADKTGSSFGLYRTFGYIGAIVSGAQMKTIFHTGATDHSFRLINWYILASCVVLIVLFFAEFRKRQRRNGLG